MDFLTNIYEAIASGLANIVSIQFWTEMLHTYKYTIVVAGALLEGEIVLILAGAAAYHQHMSLPLVMLISFLGALFHDNLLFMIGRFYGAKILKRQSAESRISKIVKLIHKYDNYFIMSFRFVYGLRTLTPIVIGSSKIALPRYAALVSISAAIWAVIVSYLGYSFAMALETIIADFQRYQKYIAIGIVVLIGVIYFITKYRKKRKASS